MTKRPDKFEKYLVGSLTTRRFCELIGFDEFIKNLVHGLNGLLKAHDRIVAREIKKLTLGLVRACQQGKIGKGKGITDVQIASLLGLSLKEIRILDDLRTATPLDPLDRVKELDRFQADLRLPNGRLSALRVARVFGLKLKQMAVCLSYSEREIRTEPDAERLQWSLGLFAKVARLRAITPDRNFRRWLRRPHRELEDQTPLQVMLRGQGQIVAWLVSDMLTGAPV